MKKVIIALVLVSLIMVPAFADYKNNFVGAEASAKFAVDANGVKFQGVGIYGTYENREEFSFGAKLGYVFSLDKDPAVSGVYVEVEKLLANRTSGPEMGPKVAFGLAADFHKIDGAIKVNLAPTARFAFDYGVSFLDHGDTKAGFGVSLRYALLNNTGVTPFSFDVEVGAATCSDK